MGDILIHIDDTLDQQAQTQLENQLLHQDGVRHATVSQSAKHLMLVDFDQEKTNSLTILHAVMKNGYQAELIGL